MQLDHHAPDHAVVLKTGVCDTFGKRFGKMMRPAATMPRILPETASCRRRFSRSSAALPLLDSQTDPHRLAACRARDRARRCAPEVRDWTKMHNGSLIPPTDVGCAPDEMLAAVDRDRLTCHRALQQISCGGRDLCVAPRRNRGSLLAFEISIALALVLQRRTGATALTGCAAQALGQASRSASAVPPCSRHRIETVASVSASADPRD